MDYKLSKKPTDGQKWFTWGSFRKNKWGNYQASFKVTPEFKKLINEVADGEYINFSAFEDKKDIDAHNQAKGNGYAPDYEAVSSGAVEGLDDEVPF